MYREIMWYEVVPTWILVYSAIGLILLAIAVSIDASNRKDSPLGWFISVLIFNFIGVMAYFITRGSRKTTDITIRHHQDSKTIQTHHINIFNDLKRELDRLYPNEKTRQSKAYYYVATEVKEKYKIAATLNGDVLKITSKNDEFEKIIESVKCLIRNVKSPNYINIEGI